MNEFYQKISVLGLSFKTAQLELREKLSSEDELNHFVDHLIEEKMIDSGIVLSTCNRVEIYYVPNKEVNVFDLLIQHFKLVLDDINDKDFYLYCGSRAIKHLFMVCSSLDSLVVGEPQITAQIKKAYQKAEQSKHVNAKMHQLIRRSLSVSKKIKTDTEIAKHAVSVSYVAVELIKKVYADLSNCKVMLLGAGEMAELCAKHLRSHSIKQLSIVNRSYDKAAAIAKEYNAETFAFDQMHHKMDQHDILIASTSSSEYILSADHLKKVMRVRKNRPFFIVDIAVPRNVNPNVLDLEEVYLYNVDDLEKISVGNQSIRKIESLKAEAMVDDEVKKYINKQELEKNQACIVELKSMYEDMFSKEIKKLEKHYGSEIEKIKKSFLAIEKKILANPINYIKSEPKSEKVDHFKKIFGIK